MSETPNYRLFPTVFVSHAAPLVPAPSAPPELAGAPRVAARKDPTLRTLRLVLPVAALLYTGCLLAAAGAGAGGAVYVSARGAESHVSTSVERTYDASRQVLKDMGVSERKVASEHDGDKERRVIDGSTADRDVTVTVESQGEGSRIEVVAKHDEVVWDKKFARQILQRIIEASH